MEPHSENTKDLQFFADSLASKIEEDMVRKAMQQFSQQQKKLRSLEAKCHLEIKSIFKAAEHELLTVEREVIKKILACVRSQIEVLSTSPNELKLTAEEQQQREEAREHAIQLRMLEIKLPTDEHKRSTSDEQRRESMFEEALYEMDVSSVDELVNYNAIMILKRLSNFVESPLILREIREKLAAKKLSLQGEEHGAEKAYFHTPVIELPWRQNTSRLIRKHFASQVLGDLTKKTWVELWKIKGTGPIIVTEIRGMLSIFGLSLKGETTNPQTWELPPTK